MSYLILCSAQSSSPLQGKYTSHQFDTAVKQEHSAFAVVPEMRKIESGGRPVYIADDLLSADTAKKVIQNGAAYREPLLNDIPLRSYIDTDKVLSVETWLHKAEAQRKKGNSRQPESQTEVIRRADKLIEKLERDGKSAILVSYPSFISILLDRFRIRGYVSQRNGIFRLKPLEMIVVSRREEHCGGCSHNCFLSNPGFGVGKEKASRIQSKKQ